MQTLFLSVFVALLLGCAANHRDGKANSESQAKNPGDAAHCSATATAPMDAKLAFNQTLRPVLKVNCGGCHGDSANAPSLFAHSDATRAYDAAVKFVDHDTPSDSYFVRRMQEGHNCGGTTACAEKKAAFITEITRWSDLMDPPPACPTPTPTSTGTNGNATSTPLPTNTPGATSNIFQTVEYTVPTTLSKTAETTVRLNLDSPVTNYGQVLFEVKLLKFEDATTASPGSYFIRSPKLATATQTLRIATVAIQVNAQPTTYNNFLSINQIVAAVPFTPTATTLPFAVLSTYQQLVPMESTQDKIRFTFTLTPASAPAPNPSGTPTPTATPNPQAELTFFTQNVKPILINRCAGCHQNSTPYRTPTNDDTTLRTNTVARVDRVTPSNSLLIRKGSGVVSHGGGTVLSAAQEATLIQWIQMIP